MKYYLGIDTSNYTTSIALFDADTNTLVQKKQLLPVNNGAIGLRQSDAVFHHTKQIPVLMEELFRNVDGNILAIGVSDRPSCRENSYMPCFMAGCALARSLAAVLHVPLYFFTHQQGHIAAAAFGAKNVTLLEKPLLAFHVSGGTTDLLYVEPDDVTIIRCSCIASSLDLKAGQLIDRVGNKLGISFPAGPQLDELSQKATKEKIHQIKIAMENGSCHLSGVENQCISLIEKGESKENVALYCLQSILEALSKMTESAIQRYGDIPILYSGGVMSNSFLQKQLSQKFSAFFAPPVFSADNAAGISWLTAKRSM